MRVKRSCLTLCMIACASLGALPSAPARAQTGAPPKVDTILYGTAYYNEYVPAAIASGCLEQDVALMQAAGINVVRMGESSWSKWEPADGQFDFAWMDRIIDRFGKAGIKVILGTPTYSIPVWMYAAHPEMLARPLGGGETSYGMRQNMNIDDPNYRRYAERIIVALAAHYRNNPNVIGWQLDNETTANGSSNASVHREFVDWLKGRYGSLDALNKAWLLSYWGQTVSSWDDFPTRDKANSTSYKLDWDRFQQWRASRFIAWQADLVRQHARPDQFLTQNHAGIGATSFNPVEMDRNIDVVGNDIYFDWQDKYDGWIGTAQGDMARSLKHKNYFVAETNARSIGWDARHQLPPYDGQMFQDVFGDISNGANMVSYWHWGTLHGGQETYWNGVLGYDMKPNRAYAEVTRIGGALRRVGSRLANLRRKNAVAMLYSIDSKSALGAMPFMKMEEGLFGPYDANYSHVFDQMHRMLYEANVGTDIVYSDDADFTGYKLLIVPALYIASDALLAKIDRFVKDGGHVIMTYRSGFANENALARWQTAPGPLAAAAGLQYQEVSTLSQPLPLKGDPYGVGSANFASNLAEFLQPTTATPLAWYDHPFFGKWPAITRNKYGKGEVLYQGTDLSDAIEKKVFLEELRRSGLYGPDQGLDEHIRVKHATSATGKQIHFYFNYSSQPKSVKYKYHTAEDMLTSVKFSNGSNIDLDPWGVVIAEER